MKYIVFASIALVFLAVLVSKYLQPSTSAPESDETVAQTLPLETSDNSVPNTSSVPATTDGVASPNSSPQEKQKPLPPLQSKDLVIGSGKQVKVGSKVSFNIIIKLKDGRIISNTYKEGRPWEGAVGNGSLLSGVDQGIRGMFQGSKRALWIPPHLAFGQTGVKPQVPPNAHLYAEVEIVSIF